MIRQFLSRLKYPHRKESPHSTTGRDNKNSHILLTDRIKKKVFSLESPLPLRERVRVTSAGMHEGRTTQEQLSRAIRNTTSTQKRILLTLLCTLLLTSSCSHADTDTNTGTDSSMIIIYSGNLDGELEPCGCSDLGNFGGIRRRATTLDELRKKHPEAFIVSAGGLLTSESVRDRLKSQYILKGFAHFKYDAVAVQWRDLAYGSAFLKLDSIPWVASNWRSDEFSKQKLLDKGGQKLTMFTWLDPAASPFLKMQGNFQKAHNKKEMLEKDLGEAKKQGAITMLATELPLQQAKSLISLKNVDLLVVKANYEEYVDPKKVGDTLVLQAGSRGMRLGKLLLQLKGGRKIKSWKHEVIPMPESIQNHPDLEVWYKGYNAKVKEAYLERVAIRQAQQEGKSQYAGAGSCAQCHVQEHQVWQKTKHAQAFSVLEAVQKSFDPDCLQCHTVGFNKKGGFIDTIFTADLINVQCESCHGAARKHIDSGGKSPVANKGWTNTQICEQCHNRAHSPGFKYGEYWPKIVHGSSLRDRTTQLK